MSITRTLHVAAALAALITIAAPRPARAQVTSELERQTQQRRAALGCRDGEDLIQCQLRANLEQLTQTRERNAQRSETGARAQTPREGGAGSVYYDSDELHRWGGKSRVVGLFCSHQFRTRSDCMASSRSCVEVPQSEVEAATREIASWHAAPAC